MHNDLEQALQWLLTFAGLLLMAATLGLTLTIVKIVLAFFGSDINL